MNVKTVTSPHSRLISEWEHLVRYNLSESAIYPVNLRELVKDPGFFEALLEEKLGYPYTNGIPKLREGIAALYSGVIPEQVVVTIGAAQANFTTAITLLDPGDEIMLLLPTYKQLGAVAQRFGFNIKTITRREEDGWAIDLDDLRKAVSRRTRLIFVCNPDNPTGRILSEAERQGLVEIAEKTGAWLLTDEVCQGTEREAPAPTAPFWGLSDRIIATNSLSKAYGLPGTRIGWVVAPTEIAHQVWSTQDYVTIAAPMLSSQVAIYALEPEVRSRLFQRTKERIQAGYALLNQYMEARPELYSLVPPQATPMAFVAYKRAVNSTDLAHQLIHEKSVLMVPGDGFGVDFHLRISFDVPEETLRAGMDGLSELLG